MPYQRVKKSLYREVDLSDYNVISQLMEKFFKDQHQGAQQRISMGGPVDDIYAALSAIRQVLPENDEQTNLDEWVPRAQKALAAAQKRFRKENGDEAGWGSATFSELSSLLMGLADES